MQIQHQNETLKAEVRIEANQATVRLENTGTRPVYLIGRGSELLFIEQGRLTNRYRAGTNITRQAQAQDTLFVFNTVQHAMGTLHIIGLGWLFNHRLDPGQILEAASDLEPGQTEICKVDLDIDYLPSDTKPPFFISRQEVLSLRCSQKL